MSPYHTELVQRLVDAGRFALAPAYSLFGVSSSGDYTLIRLRKTPFTSIQESRDRMVRESAKATIEEFSREALRGNYAGLEIRCDGMAVDLNAKLPKIRR